MVTFSPRHFTYVLEVMVSIIKGRGSFCAMYFNIFLSEGEGITPLLFA